MAVTTRSFWKGHLRLALVTIPIRLVSAADSEDKVVFHQVDRTSKKRIRYQKVAGEDGDPVSSKDIVQGFEVEPGNYVLVEPDELDALKLSTRHTLELLEFVDAADIEPLYFNRPYYVLPDGDVAEEGYRVIRDALRASKKCGIGQLTLRGRENLVALKAVGDGLLLETLRYESEVKSPGDIFSDIGSAALRPGLIEMANQLIKDRTSDFDPAKYKNHYTEAVRDLVQEKLKGGKVVEVSGGDDRSSTGTVIDFMEALRRSTGQASASETPRAASSAKTASASPRSEKPKAAAAAAARAPDVRRALAQTAEGGKSAKKTGKTSRGSKSGTRG